MDEAVGAMAAGPERANVLWRLGRIRYMADAFPAAERLFVRALEEAGEDQALRAALESAIAFSAFIQGDIHRARDHAERARELAEGIGHPEVLGPALATVGLTRFLLARGIDHALMERALALDEAADTPVEWRPRFTYAWMKLSADDLPGARVLFQALRAKAVELGDEGSLPTLLVFLSLLECRAGDWTLADLYAGEGMEASDQAGQEQTRVWALYARSAVDACFGRLDREVALDGLAMAERTGAVFPVTLFLSVLGFDALSRGDHAEAHRRLGPLTDAVKTMGVLEPGPFRFLADEIEALVALGRLDEAASLAAQLEESGRRLRRPWALAAGARCRGLVLAARSDLDGALSVFDRALERHRDLGQPFELGRTLLAKGQVERRARKWGASRRSLTEARSIFHDLGAEAWAARARDELRRIGGRVPTPAELSETERRVAQLVSTGRSNKEVAAALFMAPKTVSDNLARIYRKLGVSSRTELAARMADGTTARSGN
jgi:DNA-binding CsgD family transcriptional regulator